MRSHSLSAGGSLDACRVRAGRAGGSRALHAIPPHFYCGDHPPILHRTATSASAASRSSTDPAHADSGWHRRSASRTALRITVAACLLTIGSRRDTSNAVRSLAAALRRAACPSRRATILRSPSGQLPGFTPNEHLNTSLKTENTTKDSRHHRNTDTAPDQATKVRRARTRYKKYRTQCVV